MDCPICSLDLQYLDWQSKTEHVDMCLEHGPTVVGVGPDGSAVIVKSIPEAKRRKICPVCDKTFQNLISHYKNCCLKKDLPLNLILEQWDRIASDAGKDTTIPCDLLKNFISKCVKEKRVGEQVEFAKTLYCSMTGFEFNIESITSTAEANKKNRAADANTSRVIVHEESLNSNDNISRQDHPDIDEVHPLLQQLHRTISKKQVKETKDYKLVSANNMTKLSNIRLRIERELAASRSFQQLLAERASL